MISLLNYFKNLGYSPPDEDVYRRLSLWESWYKGDAPGFHSYSQYNGVKMVKRRRRTLNMAKKACEDKADLLLNEKLEFYSPCGKTLAFLERVFDDNNFYLTANQLVERANALGTGAFVEILDGERIVIDAVSAENIFPLATVNGRITQCAFASQMDLKGQRYIYVNFHVLENREYVIKNTFLTEGKGGLCECPPPDGLCIEPVIYTGSRRPFFQIIKPNIACPDPNSPMGISVFSGAIDILQGIDTVYDSFINEFDLGKKRIFIDASLTQVSMGDAGARLTPVFDVNDVCFYGLNGLRENGELIKEVNMQIRAEEHISALKLNLSLLSARCGLGNQYYSFDESGLKTATEVISRNSDLFRKVKKDGILLKKELLDLAKTVIYMGNLIYGGFSDEGLSVFFDDGIIEDSGKKKQEALLEHKAGLIDDAQYFAQTKDMDYEAAALYAEKMKNERKVL